MLANGEGTESACCVIRVARELTKAWTSCFIEEGWRCIEYSAYVERRLGLPFRIKPCGGSFHNTKHIITYYSRPRPVNTPGQKITLCRSLSPSVLLGDVYPVALGVEPGSYPKLPCRTTSLLSSNGRELLVLLEDIDIDHRGLCLYTFASKTS